MHPRREKTQIPKRRHFFGPRVVYSEASWQRGKLGNRPPPGILACFTVLLSKKIFPKNTKFGAENPQILGNLRAMLKLRAPIITSVGKLQLPALTNLSTHDAARSVHIVRKQITQKLTFVDCQLPL